MATKKDLIEAQKFSRGRLLSAFLGGAPGGKELEPAKPLRAVFAGIALTVMVVLVGVFAGLFAPALPSGWENNKLIVAGDTGARYVSIDGTLYPVINTVSARLIIPPGGFQVLSVDQAALEGIPVGGTIGIVGGPDALPPSALADGTGWRACSTAAHTEFWVGSQSRTAAPRGAGIVVRHDGDTFVVWEGTSHAVPAEQTTAVLRAIGLDTAVVREVRGEWLALFRTGADLAPLTVPGAGQTPSGFRHPVGSVIRETGTTEAGYLLTAEGELAPLSEVAYRLYQLRDGAGGLADAVELSPAEIADLDTTVAAGAADWPTRVLSVHEVTGTPCATLTGDTDNQRTTLAMASGDPGAQPGVTERGITAHLPEGGGAVVRAGTTGWMTLIDPTGTSYAVPGDVDTALLRMGYTPADLATVPAAWLQLLPAGPALTPEAAGRTPGTADVVVTPETAQPDAPAEEE